MNFVLSRNRDAWPTIHGFVAQVDLTIKRWLHLSDDRLLELERGEDIDEVARSLLAGEDWRRVEQVKSRKGSVTLRSAPVLEALANFADHRAANATLQIEFRFTTNARRGLEKSQLFGNRRKGIDAWEALRISATLTDAERTVLSLIRQSLRNAQKPSQLSPSVWRTFTSLLQRADDEQFHAFVRSFEFATSEVIDGPLSVEIEKLLVRLGHAVHPTQARNQYERLFLHVFKLLGQSGLKQLTRAELNAQLSLPTLSAQDTALLQQTVVQLLAIDARVATLEHTVAQQGDTLADMAQRLAGHPEKQSASSSGSPTNLPDEAMQLLKQINAAVTKSDGRAGEASATPRGEAERELLVRDGESFCNRLGDSLEQWEFEAGFRLGEEFLGWLALHEAMLPRSLLATAYYLLAELEVVRARTGMIEGRSFDGSHAGTYLRRASLAATGGDASIAARIGSLSALVSSFEEGPDPALSRLATIDHPDAVRRRLTVLLDAGRYRDAADLVRDREPHARWADRAITAYIANGEGTEAENLLSWAKRLTDPAVARQCALMTAEARYVRAFRNRKPAEVVLPLDLTTDERAELQNALVPLRGMLALVLETNRIRNEFESRAVQTAIKINAHLGQHADREKLALTLLTRTPVPPLLAELALQGVVQAPSDLPTRLRLENPRKFRPALLACRVEGELLNRKEDAFNALLALLKDYDSPNEREQIIRSSFNLAQHMGPEQRAKVREVAPSLLKSDESFLKLLEADELLHAGQTDAAAVVLESVRDEQDPNWLQHYSTCLLQRGQWREAITHLVSASRIFPHPTLLANVASLAFQYELYADAATALERLLSLDSRDIPARRHLALVYTREQRYGKAAAEFARLRQDEPDVLEHATNEAAALALAGDAESSLKAYEQIAGSPSLPLEALLGHAQVLTAAGRPKHAFEVLFARKDAFWDQQEYVGALLSASFAAEREDVGHEALLHLKILQLAGKADESVLQEKKLDDLITHIKEHREREELILKASVEGKIPWLMADRALNYPSYWGWLLRTQPLGWVFDDPLNRAEFSLYSTNSFTALKREDGARHLDPLECPAAGTAVVIDLSSLITLHRLGLLPQAAAYFGRLLLPSTYLAQVLRESSQLGSHQLSMKTAAESIKSAIENDVIATIGGDIADLPYVHEHTGDDETAGYYRLRDVASALYEAGRLPEPKHRDLLKVAHKPPLTDSGRPRLQLGHSVRFELSTLRTISQMGALDFVLAGFRVHVTSAEREQVLAELRVVSLRAEARQWHADLWKQVRSDSRFVQTPSVAAPRIKSDSSGSAEEEDAGDERSSSLAAALLADHTRLPLLADDRVFQALVLNQRPSEPGAAFGSDRLLLALWHDGLLDANATSDALLQLIEWRYRFLIVPPELLLTLAKRYISHPPGADLERVAKYVHDSMRDAGLFGGFEPTEPPSTMANRHYQEWCGVAAELVMDVWADPSFSDAAADALTAWAMQELIPMPPRSMGVNGALIASLRNRMLLSRAMIRSIQSDDRRRTNLGLRTMAAAVGLTDSEYLKIVTEVLHAA